MADWFVAARSNYFGVIDPVAFVVGMELHNVRVVRRTNGRDATITNASDLPAQELFALTAE